MSNVEPRDSEESPYQYDEPKKPLSPRRLANFAIVATSAVASVTFGLQVVGPALGNALNPSPNQTESGSSLPTPVAEVSQSAPAYPSVSGFEPAKRPSPSSLGSSLGNLATFVATESVVAPTPIATASQIQLPVGAPSFGNLSSATPYGGSSASWQSSSEQGDDDDDDQDDDRDDDDDRDEDDD